MRSIKVLLVVATGVLALAGCGTSARAAIGTYERALLSARRDSAPEAVAALSAVAISDNAASVTFVLSGSGSQSVRYGVTSGGGGLLVSGSWKDVPAGQQITERLGHLRTVHADLAVDACDPGGCGAPSSVEIDTGTATISEGPTLTTSYCGSSTCHGLDVHLSDFLPDTSYRLWVSTNCETGLGASSVESCIGSGTSPGTTNYASVVVRTDGAGSFAGVPRSFGYTGAEIWVDAKSPFPGGVMSNVLTWQ